MRLLIICAVIIGMAACSQPSESTTGQSDSTQTSRMKFSAPIQFPDDTSLFIGEVMAFEETSEFYTHAYYHKDIPDGDYYELLRKKVDSVVYSGEEISRGRLPLDIAKQFFNLGRLELISIYNRDGAFVTEATLARVEFLDGPIEGQFIIVFKPVVPSGFTKEVAYGVSQSSSSYKNIAIRTREMKNDSLTAMLVQRFELDSAKVWSSDHRMVSPYNAIYSDVSLEHGAYIIETSAQHSTILYETKEDYTILDVMPVHFEINGKPALLTTMGVNDTDMIWTSLMVYGPNGYEEMSRSRVQLK